MGKIDFVEKNFFLLENDLLNEFDFEWVLWNENFNFS